MARYHRGELGALSELIRRHQTTLYNFVAQHLGSPQAAQQIVEEAFNALILSAVRSKKITHFQVWLYSLARQQYLAHLRAQTAPELAPGHDLPSPAPRAFAFDGNASGQPERLDSFQTESVAPSAPVRQLPDELREVFLLKEVVNLSFSDISLLIGLTENETKQKLRHALDHLPCPPAGSEREAQTPDRVP